MQLIHTLISNYDEHANNAMVLEGRSAGQRWILEKLKKYQQEVMTDHMRGMMKG